MKSYKSGRNAGKGKGPKDAVKDSYAEMGQKRSLPDAKKTAFSNMDRIAKRLDKKGF
jgi:hypothetical protein